MASARRPLCPVTETSTGVPTEIRNPPGSGRIPAASSARDALPSENVVCVGDLDDSATNALVPRMRLGRCRRALMSVSVQDWSYFPNTPPETIKAMALELSISMGVTLSEGKIIT